MERIPLENIPPVLLNRMGYLIARLHFAAHLAANDAIERSGSLSIKHHGCLRVIGDEGPISQQELSARIGIDRSTMVTLVDELEANGLLTRTRNPIDRRAYALEITKAGRAWSAETSRALSESDEETYEPLNKDERAEFKRLLIKLVTGTNAKASGG